MKYIPTRMCIACRNRSSKESFIKVVRKNDEFQIDNDEKLEGRGYYICKNQQCIEKVISKKILNKVCKCDCGDAIYLKLKEIKCGKD